MSLRALTIGFLLLLALPGCIQGVSTDLAPGSIPRVIQDVEAFALSRLEQDHDHVLEVDDHVGTIGFEPLAFLPGRTGAYPAYENYFELAVKGIWAFQSFHPDPTSAYVAPNAEAGVIIYDVRNPTEPKEVGRWLGQAPSDLEITDDANWLFVSTQRNGYPYTFNVDPDAGAEGHQPRGTYVLDVRDKAHPRFVSFFPLPANGPHTLTYHKMQNGRELLLQSTYDILFTAYPQNLGQATPTQKVVITEILTEGGRKVLVPLSYFQALVPDEGQPGQQPTRQHFPHDATVHVDPATGREIMNVAYWDLGLITVDITDPANPKQLGTFADTKPSQYTKTHLVRVFPGTIDGKVVGVLEPEIPAGADAGQYTFVDLTDPAQPKRLGYWALPGHHIIDKPFLFSPHNFDLACGGNGQVSGRPAEYGRPCERPTVALSHFHGGLWILDASDPTTPRATGFFFPKVERTNIEPGPDQSPNTGFATAYIKDGHVFAPEIWTGLHVLKIGEPGVVWE